MTLRKNIKNYTTEQTVETSLANIEQMVVRMGARQVFRDYEDGEIAGIVFVMPTPNGDLPFKMPARSRNILVKLYGRHSRYSPSQVTQAKRTAWRNIHDWIDAQIALIETEQVRVEEVFLPYLTDASGTTLFQRMESGGFKLPSLGTGTAPEEGEVVE
jgi:hypothetical protein